MSQPAPAPWIVNYFLKKSFFSLFFKNYTTYTSTIRTHYHSLFPLSLIFCCLIKMLHLIWMHCNSYWIDCYLGVAVCSSPIDRSADPAVRRVQFWPARPLSRYQPSCGEVVKSRRANSSCMLPIAMQSWLAQNQIFLLHAWSHTIIRAS